jgi:cytochrome c-type biogenesis protein CcmH
MPDRREFLLSGLAVVLSVQDTLPDTLPAGRLWDPARAGRPLEPTTASDNDAAIQAIEKRLKCTCGCGLDIYTCRTTDFTCPVSPGLHRKVVALAAAGLTGEQIIAEFVRENGVAMLMAPPVKGFNLTAYFLPGLAILVTGAVLVFAILRWARRTRPADAPATNPPPSATAAELERLRSELERLEA